VDIRTLQISFDGPSTGLEVVRELLSPWDVSFTDSSEAEIIVTYGTVPEDEKSVIIPSKSPDFIRKTKGLGSCIEIMPGRLVCVDVNPKTRLNVTPACSYRYDRRIRQESSNNGISELHDTSRVYLTIDVIGEFKRILDGILKPKVSRTCQILTNAPVPYGLAPKWLKNLLMKQRNGEMLDWSFCDHLALDALRFVLVKAIEKSSGKKLLRKTWAKRRFAFVMTHDVESREGLGNSRNLKKIEDKYDLPSAWYIPSKRYELDPETVKSLASHGEIGCHDTKHDGKLAFLTGEELNLRLSEAKKELERQIGRTVEGFRAPLLQHNASVLRAIEENGFLYDSSIPTWEPKHPFTMKSHGIQTIFPLSINGLFEIPVTIPQDHQMFAVSGYGCRETLEKWVEMVSIVKDLGGLCLFLVHPDYQFADLKTGIYEEMLNFLASDSEALISLPSSLRNYRMN